jgi:hypothetical protein
MERQCVCLCWFVSKFGGLCMFKFLLVCLVVCVQYCLYTLCFHDKGFQVTCF